MNTERTTVYAAPPDLSTYTDSSGLLKITQTLIQATLPEFTSTDAFPTHRDQDGLFVIQPKDGTSSPHLTMTYEDWDGEVRTATLVHGFFLVEHTKDDGTVEREMTLSIEYVDWSDRQWTGWRRGDTFVSVKGESDPTFTDADDRLADRRPPRRGRWEGAGVDRASAGVHQRQLGGVLHRRG